MADLTDAQKTQIAASIQAAQSQLKADNTTQVIVSGGGLVTSSNASFKIEKRTD